jgi:hypothetical protein
MKGVDTIVVFFVLRKLEQRPTVGWSKAAPEAKRPVDH